MEAVKNAASNVNVKTVKKCLKINSSKTGNCYKNIK